MELPKAAIYKNYYLRQVLWKQSNFYTSEQVAK